MKEGVLLISDLHLSDADPEGIVWFESFAGWVDPRRFSELLILGDLFDYWVGPRQMAQPGYLPVLRALSSLAERGVRVTCFRGNRDGFLEERFARTTGVRIGGDFVLRETAEGRAVLTHGDLLCTRDRSYQRFRRFLRSRTMSWLGPRLPLSVGLLFARGFRRYSQRVVPQKPPAEKGLVEEEIRAVLRRFEARFLVCGHVHFREEREVDLGERRGKLFVLPAFEKGEDALVCRGRLAFASQRELGYPG